MAVEGRAVLQADRQEHPGGHGMFDSDSDPPGIPQSTAVAFFCGGLFRDFYVLGNRPGPSSSKCLNRLCRRITAVALSGICPRSRGPSTSGISDGDSMKFEPA